MKHNIYFIIILISALCQGQNLIIKNGQFNDAYDRDIIKDISIGNVCEQEFFLNLYYNGDMYLKGDKIRKLEKHDIKKISEFIDA